MRLLVLGAGVIGQVYSARLAAAGHDVTIVARGTAADRLRRTGISTSTGDSQAIQAVQVADHVPTRKEFDAALLSVRADQMDDAATALTPVEAEALIVMSNVPEQPDRLVNRLGAHRTVLAFPGIGGERLGDGTIRYAEIPQQHTILERHEGVEQPFVVALQQAGFVVDQTDNMPAWLTTHAAFIVGAGAAILAMGGDSASVGRDRRRTTQMVTAIGETLTALRSHGIPITPTPIRVIFTRMPRAFAVAYWRRQMRGPVGTLALAPHIRSTRDTEFPVLVNAVRSIIGESAPTLRQLLSEAGVD